RTSSRISRSISVWYGPGHCCAILRLRLGYIRILSKGLRVGAVRCCAPLAPGASTWLISYLTPAPL
ncbi:MAG TPA: hypothetical protein VFW76_02545, partial [Ktedonobacterales bacterium]|nr:hypothetical protein [Ktedonobacterales bacterium]